MTSERYVFLTLLVERLRRRPPDLRPEDRGALASLRSSPDWLLRLYELAPGRGR